MNDDRGYSVDLEQGLLIPAEYLVSPNQDDRPLNTEISLLVVHNISLPPRQFAGCFVEDFFCNHLDTSAHAYFEEIGELRVSSHVYIRRDGSVVQFVPFSQRAWHAGQSNFAGRERCNDYSIGIELQGADDIPYEEAQYRALIGVTKALKEAYPSLTDAVGHEHIAPGRKTDPGPSFDWTRFLQAIS